MPPAATPRPAEVSPVKPAAAADGPTARPEKPAPAAVAKPSAVPAADVPQFLPPKVVPRSPSLADLPDLPPAKLVAVDVSRDAAGRSMLARIAVGIGILAVVGGLLWLAAYVLLLIMARSLEQT